MTRDLVPVLEIGGTHVSAAAVDADTWQVVQFRRHDVDGAASADDILATFASAAAELDVASQVAWGIAMPDPFDYDSGIARFRDVGKFEALDGVDVGADLLRRIPQQPAAVRFLNDADAFVLGEWTLGSAAGHRRCVGITLGTGLGTGWLVDGAVTTDAPGVPPLGRARTLGIDGIGLEELVSRRGIRRAYAQLGGDAALDVREIAGRAREDDEIARRALDSVFDALGRGLAASLHAFEPDVIVVGGSIARSWSLMQPAFLRGLDWPDAPPILLAAHPDDAAVRGAARYAVDGVRRQ